VQKEIANGVEVDDAQEKTMAKSTAKSGSGKRELIDTGKDKRYVKRDVKGQFKESDDVSKSLSKDVKKAAKTKVKPGYGDQGDQPKKKSPKK
jgi:hypothetical protein